MDCESMYTVSRRSAFLRFAGKRYEAPPVNDSGPAHGLICLPLTESSIVGCHAFSLATSAQPRRFNL